MMDYITREARAPNKISVLFPHCLTHSCLHCFGAELVFAISGARVESCLVSFI